LAALISVSRAHVEGLPSAARSIWANSEADRRIWKRISRRSLAFNFGLPRDSAIPAIVQT